MTPEEMVAPTKNGFERDPFGYAALGWHKWAMAQNLEGIYVDLKKGPTGNDLKSPILWLAHAHALSEAAVALLRTSPNLDPMPASVRGVSHCQYHATALMLVGYSLEVCLKAMLIMKRGIAVYQAEEKKYFHHSLDKLSEFIPDLCDKDRGILQALSHFVRWAGRYPDPGFGKESQASDIYELSERHRISAKDLFVLASRIMSHVKVVADEN